MDDRCQDECFFTVSFNGQPRQSAPRLFLELFPVSALRYRDVKAMSIYYQTVPRGFIDCGNYGHHTYRIRVDAFIS